MDGGMERWAKSEKDFPYRGSNPGPQNVQGNLKIWYAKPLHYMGCWFVERMASKQSLCSLDTQFDFPVTVGSRNKVTRLTIKFYSLESQIQQPSRVTFST